MNLTTKLKHLPWFEIFIVVTLLGINGYAAFSDAQNFPNRWFTRDDAYYYYKVAQNISEGLGSTFDGINQTNGYHPLWMLVNIPIFALARFDVILPLRILLLVLAGLRAATSILLYRVLKRTLAHPVAMLGALYWAFSLFIHVTAYQEGLETGLAAFFIVLLLYQVQRFDGLYQTAPAQWKQVASLAILATLVMFSRLDLVFLAGIFGLWIVFRGHALRTLLPLDLILLTISTTAAFIIRIGFPAYYLYATMTLATLVVNLVVTIPLLYFFRLYEHPRANSLSHIPKQSFIVSALSTILTMGIMLGLTNLNILEGSFPRSAPVFQGALTFIFLTGVRTLIFVFSSKRGLVRASPIEILKNNWKKWLREGSLYYGILGGTLGLYMLWSKMTFGTASPVSGQIKRWWGSFPSRVYGGAARSTLSFFGIAPEGDFNAWQPLTTAIGDWQSKIGWLVRLSSNRDTRYFLVLLMLAIAFIFLLLIQRKRAARIINQLALFPLVAGAVFQVIQYNIAGYAAPKEWYWVSQLIIMVLAGCLLLDILTRALRQNTAAYVSLYLVALFFGVSNALQFYRYTARIMPYNKTPANAPYMEVISFVEYHTTPGSLIGMTGGGNVGYFIQDRTIVNMDGLINSYPYFLANRSGHGSDFLFEMGLDYVFANPNFLETQPYRGQYTGRFKPIEGWGGKAVMRFLPAP